jgi:hypothetical protein
MSMLRPALPWILSCALGCGGPTTSLDTDVGSSTAVETTTGTETTSASEGDETTDDAPVICAPECEAILASTWVYEGPPGSYAIVELLRDADGGLWLGTQQSGGGVGLVHLSAQGALEWAVNPGLPCEGCELADIALHPAGDVMLSATATAGVPSQAVIARFDVAARAVAWVRTLALSVGTSTRPRLGALAVLDEDRIAVLRINGFSDGEVLEVFDFTADGTLRVQGLVGSQPGSGDQWPPLAEPGPTGELLLAHRWWNDQTEQMAAATTRFVPNYTTSISRVLLPLSLDDLAVDEVGRRFELARSRGTDTITLVLTHRSSTDPERWSVSLPLLSTSSTRAALAVGPDGAVYLAARTTPRAPPGTAFVTTLAVARWSADGELRWQAALPLDMMATPDPVELVIDEAHGVIVGTVIAGRATVVRYEQACVCE